MTVIAPNTGESRVATSFHGWLLVATCWLSSTGAVLIAPVLPLMRREFADTPHADLLTVIALVVPGLMIALFSPVVGAIVDRVGRKRLYLTAISLYAVAGILPWWLTNLYAIVASRVFIGLAEAAISTIATALVANYFSGTERQKWLTLQHASASIVAVAMFSIGGVLGSLSAGWRTPFLIYGCAIIFLPLIVKFVWEPRDAEPASPVAARLPFPWREAGPLSAFILFASVMFFVVPVQISFLITARGVSEPAVIGLGGAIANAGIPIGSFMFHRLARWPINRLLVIAFALLATGLFTIAQLPTVYTTVAGAFVAGIGSGMVLPLLGTWLIARLPFEQSGRGTGCYMGAFFLGSFLSPLLVAFLAYRGGGLIAAIGQFGVACAVVAALVLMLALVKKGAVSSVHAARADRAPLA
ncbi:MFS family permease [Paraburkholderia sp. WC7.3g]|uniref:MFS transporter n=1 Tax=Paraburkholderia sp. WC7.3g TaxID=2991070 RepID=UPI003D1F1C88